MVTYFYLILGKKNYMGCFLSGIKFIFKSSIQKYLPKENDNKVLSKIELEDGTTLPADIAILGIGSFFNTDWLRGSSIKMLDNGSVEVNKVIFIIFKKKRKYTYS